MAAPIPTLVASDRLIRQMQGKRPRRFRKPRIQRLPDAIARDYERQLLQIVDRTREQIETHIVANLPEFVRVANARIDAERADVDNFSQRLAAALLAALATDTAPEAETQAAQIGRAVAAFNAQQIRRQMRGIFEVDVFLGDARLEGLLDDFAAQNAKLIKSIPEQYLSQVEDITRRSVRSGRRAEEIRGEIEQRFGVTRSRAALIARDQISKINSNLTRDRHQQLGLTEYIWRTSRDERVRASHTEMEGTRQSWDDPPNVGGRNLHPGEDYRCRCTAEPVIPGAGEPVRTTPADVLRGRPARRRRTARRTKKRARPTTPPALLTRTATLPRTGREVNLSDAQMRRRVTAARLQNNAEARASASRSERADLLLWNWVHGSKRKTSVMLKSGAIREFGLRGVAFNPRGFNIAEADISRTGGDLRRVWRRTQDDLRRRGTSTVTAYRGVRGDIAERGAVESWSTSEATARKFAGAGGKVLKEEIPAEQILAQSGGPDWVDGVFGNQDELLVLF